MAKEKIKIKRELDKLIREIAKKEGVSYNKALNFILALGVGRYVELIALPKIGEIIKKELKAGKTVGVFAFTVKKEDDDIDKSYV
jgi:hypothetical protein